jgi:hypothetical protein
VAASLLPAATLTGTDYPFDLGATDPLSRLDDAGRSGGERDLIAGGNAERWGWCREADLNANVLGTLPLRPWRSPRCARSGAGLIALVRKP